MILICSVDKKPNASPKLFLVEVGQHLILMRQVIASLALAATKEADNSVFALEIFYYLWT
jgi:hypothetical protein